MPAAEQETYIARLARLGYCWQFITLAGLHTTALISDQFARAFARQGMRAYGELVQEPEMAAHIDVVTHQKWSGANYVDNLLRMVTGGVSSTSSMGSGVTEEQFGGKGKRRNGRGRGRAFENRRREAGMEGGRVG